MCESVCESMCEDCAADLGGSLGQKAQMGSLGRNSWWDLHTMVLSLKL